MPKLGGILETALYTGDMARARRFYEEILGLKAIFGDERLCAYGVAERSVLLLFRRGTTSDTVTMPGGTIPGHEGSGRIHVAFAIGRDELSEWETRLAANNVEIEGRTDWSRGGHSIYFRDPDGHLLELATPGLWPVY